MLYLGIHKPIWFYSVLIPPSKAYLVTLIECTIRIDRVVLVCLEIIMTTKALRVWCQLTPPVASRYNIGRCTSVVQCRMFGPK